MRHVQSQTPADETPSVRNGRRLHLWPLRIMHWVNAVVMLIMITSGWGIYDDDVIIRGFHFSPFWRLGDWAAWSLNWHFAGMWFLVINGLIYLVYGFASGRFREKLLPIRPTEVVQTIIDTDAGKAADEVKPWAADFYNKAAQVWGQHGEIINLPANEQADMMKTLATVGQDVVKRRPNLAAPYQTFVDAANRTK